MIDDTGFSNKEIEDELLKLFPPESNIHGINNLCKHLISSNANADKYIHHLFLRYLYFRQPEDLVNQYTNGQRHWKDGNHHPWSWIQTYRGLLLIQRGRQGVEWLEKGLAEVSFKGVELPVGLALLLIAANMAVDATARKSNQAFIQHKFTELKGKIPSATGFMEHLSPFKRGNLVNRESGCQIFCRLTSTKTMSSEFMTTKQPRQVYITFLGASNYSNTEYTWTTGNDTHASPYGQESELIMAQRHNGYVPDVVYVFATEIARKANWASWCGYNYRKRLISKPKAHE